MADDLLRRLGVGHQVLDDHVHRHRVVLGVPAVVVGDQRDGGVADLGFPGELGFLQVGHADHVAAPRPIQLRLRERRELRPFHADIRAAVVRRRTRLLRAFHRERGEMMGERMREPDVRDDAVAEEGADAAAGAIDELIGKHQVLRRIFLLQAAHRARRHDPIHAEHLHTEDVGPVVQLARVQPMALAVARQECHALAAECRQHIRTGRIAKRRRQGLLFAIGELGHVVEAAAADNSNLC